MFPDGLAADQGPVISSAIQLGLGFLQLTERGEEAWGHGPLSGDLL
jgi:hypothetical protein